MATEGIEVNTVAFEGAMQRLRKGVREGFIDPQYGTLTVAARMLAEQCQKFTPPRNLAQGNIAVVMDLTRIYFPQSERTYTGAIRKVVRMDNRNAWDSAAVHFGNSHGLRNTKAIAFTEQLHQQKRGRRGRAFRGKYGNLGTVTLGPQAKLAREYIAKVKARVGWARGGWNQGILAFGGQVPMEWVRRHSVNRGRIIDGRQDVDPYVGVVNDTGWARYNSSEGERIVRNSINARIRDMYSHYEHRMRLAAAGAMKAA